MYADSLEKKTRPCRDPYQLARIAFRKLEIETSFFKIGIRITEM